MGKAIQLLQVAAYCDGRMQVEEIDVFLLQHVLWKRPEQVEKIYDWLLKQVGHEFGTRQAESLYQSLQERSIRKMRTDERTLHSTNNPSPSVKTGLNLLEIISLKDTLLSRLKDISSAERQLKNKMDRKRDRNIWLEDDEFDAIANSMSSRLSTSVKGVRFTLHRVLLMETLIRREIKSPKPLDLHSSDVYQILI